MERTLADQAGVHIYLFPDSIPRVQRFIYKSREYYRICYNQFTF